MNRKQIAANIGKLVAYTDPRSNSVVAAKVIDAQLWEVSGYPEKKVRLSSRYHANRGSYREKVGYPVLMLLPGIHRSPAQQQRLEQWLADTVITMDDLFDGEGSERSPQWSEIEGTIFRVVFPNDLREDLPGAIREWMAAQRAKKDAYNAMHKVNEATRESAANISNTLASLGHSSPDELPIVSWTGLGTGRVSLPVEALEELVKMALPLLNGCDGCGVHAHLLPQERPGGVTEMLCISCHPDCRQQ